MLIGMERPGKAMTAILPQASETGTGVPRAATLRRFDGPRPSDVPLLYCVVNSIEIPLRRTDGMPRADDEIVDAYAAAAVGANGRRVVYLTHSTKTGLIAPVAPPMGVDVIVDACQGRIEPFKVAKYLRNGWPVVVTGSKFFGGPAFSGAVLFPTARLLDARRGIEHGPARYHTETKRMSASSDGLGMLLRWIAALRTIEAFALSAGMIDRLQHYAAAIQQGIGRISTLVPIPGLSGRGPGWIDIPTIFSFAVRDPANWRRLLSSPELRSMYTELASNGVLLGQPVEFGCFGGLRIAVGARDLLPSAPTDGGLPRLFEALEEAVVSQGRKAATAVRPDVAWRSEFTQ
jgi:hypothetical protein